MDQYPAIAFIVKHGKPLALTIGLLPPLLVALLLQVAGIHWMWSVLALAMLPLTYLVARACVELVTIIADMLLPK